MKLHIEVTQEDIDEGCKADGSGYYGGCMVWRAFQRATEGAFDKVTVGHHFVNIYEISPSGDNLMKARVSLPSFVAHEISNYDLGELVKPFSFEADLYYL